MAKRRFCCLKATLYMIWAMLTRPILLFFPLLFVSALFGLYELREYINQLPQFAVVAEQIANPEAVKLTVQERTILTVVKFTPLLFLLILLPFFFATSCAAAQLFARNASIGFFSVIGRGFDLYGRVIAATIVTIFKSLPFVLAIACGAYGLYLFSRSDSALSQENTQIVIFLFACLLLAGVFLATRLLITPLAIVASGYSMPQAFATARLVIQRKLASFLIMLIAAAGSLFATYYSFNHTAISTELPAPLPLLGFALTVALLSWYFVAALELLCIRTLEEIASAHLQSIRASVPVITAPSQPAAKQRQVITVVNARAA